MATLVLQMAGSAIGGAIGGPFGAMAGRALGAVAGSMIDNALLSAGTGKSRKFVEGPRLSEMGGLTSTEGAPIPRVYGRVRIGGQLIWATRFEEVVSTRIERGGSSGGKGLSGGGSASVTYTTEYAYFANIAVGLCEGPIAFVRRVWADGKEIDLTGVTMRVHHGGEGQMPDPLIVAKEGGENVPAYRGLAYAVFERLALAPFGNRIPQLSFEVVRPVNGVAEAIRGVNLIPGSGEFVYETQAVRSNQGAFGGRQTSLNRHQLTHASDFDASLDALQACCPNLQSVTLIVSWFGDDLRAAHCQVTPRIEDAAKGIDGASWVVAGQGRGDVAEVSRIDGRPAFGGTPSDPSVMRAIAAIKARGWKVNLHPFLMLDVPHGNGLPDPYTGQAGQPAYPWRGEVTVDPAPRRPGSADGTVAALTQIAAFVGTAQASEFANKGESIVYSGDDDWSWRRFVLHYAKLAVRAGGVDTFIIGSELPGLTHVRDGGGAYPMVSALAALAADVKAVLGQGTKITYGADWTEYGAHVPDQGTLRFPLDPLWAHPAIDAVGIDWYPPLSDWRDGTSHLDAELAESPTDRAYLQGRVASGEAFDWYYADDAEREAQIRRPITDDDHSKPWVHRPKDLVSWWSQPHVERAGGVETAATAWQPRSKPIWLLEIGCPAVDRGANSPNLFPDPKSDSSGLPPFSRGQRDDLVMLRALEATMAHFDPALGATETANPVSPLYGGRMLDSSRTHCWAWDARPFPAFPDAAEIWGDTANWETGHWFNGRVEGATLDRLLPRILADLGLEPIDAAKLDGLLDGYVIDRPMSARSAIEPLATLFGFDLVSSGGAMRFVPRPRRVAHALTRDDLVPDRDGRLIGLTRAQESELPLELSFGFIDGEREYRHAAALSRRLTGASLRQNAADTAVVSRLAEIQRLADIRLHDLWAARETAEFAVPPTLIEIEMGDLVSLPVGEGRAVYQVTRVRDGASRTLSARAVDPAIHDHPAPRIERPRVVPPKIPGRPAALVLDLPLAIGAPPGLQYLAAFADPWPGALAVWRANDAGGFDQQARIERPAMLGQLLDALPPGPTDRWHDGAAVRIVVAHGTLASVTDQEALAGANSFAVRKGDGAFEIISAARAELVAPATYRLSRFLRGLGGSDALAATGAAAGGMLVRLDEALLPLTDRLGEIGVGRRYRIGPAGFDPGDERFVAVETQATRLALMPYAPVHLRARRTSEGIRLGWVRRGRVDADAWEVAEIPLGEDSERYEIDILAAGGGVRRTLVATAPALLYPAADEITDFGAAQSTLTIAVSQISSVAGRGFIRTAVLPVV